VKLEPGRSLLDLIAIKQELEDLLGREVDVVTEDGVSPYIREQVLKEAVSL
jgi:predicted nucleotidyltransferase